MLLVRVELHKYMCRSGIAERDEWKAGKDEYESNNGKYDQPQP